jgi:hypothetical protein
MNKKTILILVANPQNTTSLNLPLEIRNLQEAIQRSLDRDRFVIELKFAVQQKDLRRYLLDFKPWIIHFCGHGTKKGLILHDEKQQAEILSNQLLSDLLKNFADRLECLVLNACETEPLAEEVVKHINYAIGMNQEVKDGSAIIFAEAFYDAIGAGESIEKAFNLGKNAISGINSFTKIRKLTAVEQDMASVREQIQEDLIPVLWKKQVLKSIIPWGSDKNTSGLDVFHYRWAALRCLGMLRPKSSIKHIVIEDLKENMDAGEYEIDITEYAEDIETHCEEITYFQLKYSTKKVDQPFNLSDLKDTLVGFAERFSALFKAGNEMGNEACQSKSVRFAIVTNWQIANEFRAGVLAIRNGEKPEKQFRETLEKYTQLKDDKLQHFCTSLDLIDEVVDYIVQRRGIDSSEIDSVIALVQDKTLPGSNREIVREDILKRLGVTSERDLFPVPPEFEKSREYIKREQHESLINTIFRASTPLIIYANGGVGKSVFARQIAEYLPAGSLGIVYDCFGAGKYRNGSEPRHRHRDALVQIANEIALHGLCELLIPPATHLDDAILRDFLSRLCTAATALRKIHRDAVLVILIDAADNAEMAAKEFADSCFANQLLREKMLEGVRIVALCRTERIKLLQPLSTVQLLELLPFSEIETLTHLREHFPDAADIDGVEFHRLTAGNPRVQANSLSINHNAVADVLAALGPSVTTVDEQIAAQLELAIANIKDKLPNDFQQYIDTICLGLANLTPFIPIQVLATAAEIEPATVVSFVADLGRPLWISENSVQFRDEPTETWFRAKFSASVEQIEGYVTRLKPLASEFAYVAQVLPSLLLQSENYDQLIGLALSDDLLPQDNPIDERNVRVYRLQFALKAALKQKKYADAAKLALRAGEEVAGDKRQIELLKQNVDLIAPLQSQQRVQELAFRRQLRGGWSGSDNIYAAALLASIEEFKGEARVFLRAASNWLSLYFEEHRDNKEQLHEVERLTDNDIVEMATAHFRLYGTEKLVDFILSWRPPEVIFRVTRLFIKRFVDAGDFTTVDEISHLGCRNQYLMIAVADELIAVGKFPPIDAMRVCLALLIHKQSRISKPTEYWAEQAYLSAIISFAEASSAVGLSRTKILRLLKHYFPQRGSRLVSMDYHDGERHLFLRGTALRFTILGDFEPDIESLIPKKLLEDKKNSQDINDFKQVVGGLLPWYLIRSRILLGNKEHLELAFQEANVRSKKARSQRYRQQDRLPFEIARVRFESLVLKNARDSVVEASIIETIFDGEYNLSLIEHLKAVRAAYRLEHLSPIRDQLEQSCYERVASASDEGPEAKANYYIDLARAVFPISRADAVAYFNFAIKAVSKFGDELVERWGSVVAMAKRSAEGGLSSPELAYRFIRCAELVGDNVVRQKHWSRNEAIQVCAKLCPMSAFAALSRWRDRDVGRFDSQLLALAHEAVRSNIVAPSVGWSLSAFFWEYQFEEFVVICIETESDKARRQYILNTAVRDLRLNDTSENNWQNLKRVAERFSLDDEEIRQVLEFQSEQKQLNLASQTRNQEQKYEDTNHQTQVLDLEQIFEDLDLTTTIGLNTAIDRFDALPYPHNHEAFWKAIYERVSANNASNFLLALTNAEKADLYDIECALSSFPDSYRQKISVKQCWDKVLSLISQRFAHQLIGYMSNEEVQKYLFEKMQLGGVSLPLIYAGIIRGLSESPDLVNASELFGFSTVVSLFITPEEAKDLLEFALSRFELHISENYGDGCWDDWLLPPNNISDAFAGFVWAALGSPRSSVRWQAAHCVRRLVEAGCKQELNSLIEWMNQDCVNAFGSRTFPFYNLHARLYLLIALSRISVDNPELLHPHYLLFKHHALDGLPHALIQKFAAEIALSIEATFPKTYESNVVESLRAVRVSQLPVKAINGYKENFQETPWHARGEVDCNLKLHFGWDFARYWFEPLGGIFGISGRQVEELAREVVLKKWNIMIEDDFIRDPRSNLWNSSQTGRETEHSHGSYPRTDDFSFYISYHAMLAVAARLLLEMPVVHSHSWCENWTDWLQRHTLVRADGRWLADRRDPPPLERRAWLSEKTTENWRQDIKPDDFLDGLLTNYKGETWLNIYGSWSDSDSERQESFYITSALVSQRTSESLLNALSTCLNPYDFKLPAYEEETMKFNEPPFELQGWIWRGSQDEGLDAADPHAGKIDYPPYRIGDSIIKQLELSLDLEQRKWFLAGRAEESVICELWSTLGEENKKETPKHGVRMSASLDFLKHLGATFERELIIEIQIERRLPRSSYYTRSNDDREYPTPNSKIYILSADGKLRDAGTCYQLR